MKSDWSQKKIERKVLKNKRVFENYLELIKTETDILKKLTIAKTAAKFAVSESTGYFRSSVLENTFTDYAKLHDLKSYDIQYIPNSFLHVMTQAYNTGGHTRVVERWITHSPSSQKHSIVLLNQNDVPYPSEYFEEITGSRNGLCIQYNEELTDLERALSLRQLGMEYEFIVLHIHMDDPTALIAFGTEKFTRPVIFFNHADHLFWLGVSIADKVADLRTITSISKQRRGIINPYMLGVPSDSTYTHPEEKHNISDLAIPEGKKVILTSGSPHKYSMFFNQSLSEILIELTQMRSDVFCLVIGPSRDEKQWKDAWKKSSGNVNAIGYVDYNKGYLNYISRADLVIDSWPMGGGTALIDALSLSKPVLSLKSPLGQFDYLLQSLSYCTDKSELITKTLRVLDDEKFAKAVVDDCYQHFCRDHSIDAWAEKVNYLVALTPKEHKVKILDERDDINIIDELCLLNCSLYSGSKTKKYLTSLLQLLSSLTGMSDRQIIQYIKIHFNWVYRSVVKII